MRRGEIWWADLGQPIGSAPTGERPVMIISDDAFNASGINTVTVITLTSSARLAARPGNVLISAGDSGLRRDSVANVTALATVDRSALRDPAGRLPGAVMRQVDAGLRLALGL